MKKIWQITEEKATMHLIKKGYIIFARNFSIYRVEIDIIANKGDTIYFFEVKKVRKNHYQNGFPAISHQQFQRYKKAREKLQIFFDEFVNISIGFLIYDENDKLLNFCKAIF